MGPLLNAVSLPLGALAIATVVIGLGFRALLRGRREGDRLWQALLIAGLATALHPLISWIWAPGMGQLGFFLIQVGAIAVLLSLRLDPHDRAQFLLNLACTDLGLSTAWAIQVASGDPDVTGEIAILVGVMFAQIVIVLAALTSLGLHAFVALVERRAASGQ